MLPVVDLCGSVSRDETLSPEYASAYILTCPVTVPHSVTVTLAPGTVVKGQAGAAVEVEGALDANGTAGEPVTFTSVADNSVGGATGDGRPSAGGWTGIAVQSGGSAALLGTTLDYAITGLAVAEGGTATIHGAVLNSNVGVSANTYVDATEVNWGSQSGPAPIGTGTPVTGEGVWTTPWVGYAEALKPPPASWQPAIVTCSDYLVIGARGSSEAPVGDPPVFTGNESGFGQRNLAAYEGFKSSMEAAGVGSSQLTTLGLHYPAVGISLPLFIREEYLQSVAAGEEELISELEALTAECPKERVVLVGYSQGALVIHLALRTLAVSDPSLLTSEHLAGVMLIADPARVPHGAETVWEAPEVQAAAGSAVAGASGVWTAAAARGAGPLPSSVKGGTISFCAYHDIVCAPTPGASWSVHDDYYQSANLEAMGRWMAGHVLGAG
jgi:hypothetical protein